MPEIHLARFIWRVLSGIDFSALEHRYAATQGGPGRSPYHPRVIAALWIYGMSQGLDTATAIAEACRLRDDFRWLAGGLCPCDQTLLNWLDHEQELAGIWAQVLQAMHREGHVDLSAIAEDGSKVRANASPRSFRSGEEIEAVVQDLTARLAAKIEQCAAKESDRKDRAQIRALQDRLQRARQAAEELRERAERRAGAQRTRESDSQSVVVPPTRFSRTDFRYDAEPDALICPSGRVLRFIGEYCGEHGRGAYRLYARRDCSDCPLQAQCTTGSGRRVKVPVGKSPDTTAVAAMPAKEPTEAENVSKPDKPATPRASLTDPEALMMLATSEKVWQPSYNADIAVDRHGIIVSQFLTKRPTDFHSFPPALHTVLSTLGRPQSWIGDGHYGTHANLLLADQHGVVLYASPEGEYTRTQASAAGSTGDGPLEVAHDPVKHHHRAGFRHDTERDVVICPANQELRFLGRYPTDNGIGTYRLYARSDCSDCTLKAECTSARGRRFKLADTPRPRRGADPDAEAGQFKLAEIIRARDARMAQQGEDVMRFRRSTVEPAHSHLKQHGFGRLHVRGLRRGSAILSLASTSHNIMKWRARENARALRLAA